MVVFLLVLDIADHVQRAINERKAALQKWWQVGPPQEKIFLRPARAREAIPNAAGTMEKGASPPP